MQCLFFRLLFNFQEACPICPRTGFHMKNESMVHVFTTHVASPTSKFKVRSLDLSPKHLFISVHPTP